MEVEIPERVSSKMAQDERIVGHMVNLFKETIFFTKKGCSSKGGCENYIYRESSDYDKESLLEVVNDLEKYEKRFVSAFLWN